MVYPQLDAPKGEVENLKINHFERLDVSKISPTDPLEDTPDPSPTVRKGLFFFVGVWGRMGYLPRVCGKNHGM